MSLEEVGFPFYLFFLPEIISYPIITLRTDFVFVYVTKRQRYKIFSISCPVFFLWSFFLIRLIGSYGKVMKAKYRGFEVAVKQMLTYDINDPNLDEAQKKAVLQSYQDFRHEAWIMR